LKSSTTMLAHGSGGGALLHPNEIQIDKEVANRTKLCARMSPQYIRWERFDQWG